ncbi:transporter substrate-binding domain-containing protein [Geobacter sp. FeAm09]|uniref:transporter substrate-binding domain-containing protein n=1 Tax=Geobacter sp. FeAm09 TaxID=2597769 RepID=UPI00143D0290|nr:transporter substrate-binding domain-containing protein [Geobacter sp. FeAm09]
MVNYNFIKNIPSSTINTRLCSISVVYPDISPISRMQNMCTSIKPAICQAIAIIFLALSCCGELHASGEHLVQENKTIIVGANINYPPYEFLDKNGKLTGYNVDLYRAIARVMGLDIKFSYGPWHEKMKDLQQGRVDILMGLGYTQERTKLMDFSPPHTIINVSLFGRSGTPKVKSIKELKDKKVIILRGGRLHEYAIEQGLTGNSIVLVDNYADGLRLLASGHYDYALFPKMTGIFVAQELGLASIKPINEISEVIEYCSAVKKGNRELLARFATGMAILKKTGQYKDIHDKWLGVLEPRGIPLKRVIKVGSIVGFFLLGGLLHSFVWSAMLKRQVEQRTSALSLEVKERQRAEEELRRNQEQLVQASKMAAIGTLVSGVAHEINNPNGLIYLNVTMLSDMYESIRHIMEDKFAKDGDFIVGKWQYSEVRENLEQLLSETLDASKRVGRIVEDLKNFSKRDNSELNEIVDINSATKSAIRLISTSIKQSTDFFSVSYDEKIPKIRGNMQRIEQVVVNLIVNACQSLAGRDRSITVMTRYDYDHRMAELEITDEGVGIASDQLQYIADPFYTTKREQGGTGLGLSVSSKIVKDHGGILTINSSVGKGTTAILSLPIYESGDIS